MTVIWDWNGTLLDDVSLNISILNRLLALQSLPPLTKDAYRRAFGFPIRDFYTRVGFDFEKNSYEQLAEKYWEYYHAGFPTCSLSKGAVETLKALPCRHIILSASPQSVLEEQVAHFSELTPYISRVLGCGDGFGKSKLDLARAIVGQDEYIVVGDTDHDEAVAKVLGCRFIGYTGGHQMMKGIASLEELKNEINL